MAEWDSPAPECPRCSKDEMVIDFRPVGLIGAKSRAVKHAEKIMEEDYGVADYKSDGRVGGRGKVRYKDNPQNAPSNWGIAQQTLLSALELGREARMQSGGMSGVDILKENLRNGSQPDLIANSKKMSARIW